MPHIYLSEEEIIRIMRKETAIKKKIGNLIDSMLCDDSQISIKGLAITIEKAWSDVALRNSRSDKGKIIMNAHPTWSQVGMEWINLLKQND